MKQFKKPDLNAPRFRPKKENILNTAFYKRFIEKNPKYKDILSLEDVKSVIKSFNGKIWQTVIQNRDGIELPEQLGYVFIGSCPRKTGDNPDYKKSITYGYRTQNKNWESDEYVAKIFYTNYENKYRFRFHELWGFTGVRDFKRSVAHTYPKEWKKYLLVDKDQQVSKLFRKEKNKEYAKKESIKKLDQYDEFDFS